MTGTSLASMALTMARIEDSSPPGVSITSTRARDPRFSESRIWPRTCSAVMGVMAPETWMTSTTPASGTAGAGGATAAVSGRAPAAGPGPASAAAASASSRAGSPRHGPRRVRREGVIRSDMRGSP